MRDRSHTDLYLPFLRPFYQAVEPLAWPLIRIAVGWNFAVHGWGKVIAGPTAMLPAFAELGFHDATPLICFPHLHRVRRRHLHHARSLHPFLRRRLRDRARLYLLRALLGNGFSWLKRGYEYTLLWGLLCFAIALQGSGRYALDRLIGREL